MLLILKPFFKSRRRDLDSWREVQNMMRGCDHKNDETELTKSDEMKLEAGDNVPFMRFIERMPQMRISSAQYTGAVAMLCKKGQTQ